MTTILGTGDNRFEEFHYVFKILHRFTCPACQQPEMRLCDSLTIPEMICYGRSLAFTSSADADIGAAKPGCDACQCHGVFVGDGQGVTETVRRC